MSSTNNDAMMQWRRQDLLRGGAKLKIMSWGTRGELYGRLQQLLDN